MKITIEEVMPARYVITGDIEHICNSSTELIGILEAKFGFDNNEVKELRKKLDEAEDKLDRIGAII